MRVSRVLLYAVLGTVVVGVLGGGCTVRGYNRALGLRDDVHNQWSQVEGQLLQRYQGIPYLVATLKAAAGREQKVHPGIAEVEKAYRQFSTARTVAQKAVIAGQLEALLSQLMLLEEAYPALKSNEAFSELRAAIAATEKRMDVERRRYNMTVMRLNAFARQLPGSFFANMAGVEQASYFQPAASPPAGEPVGLSDNSKRS